MSGLNVRVKYYVITRCQRTADCDLAIVRRDDVHAYMSVRVRVFIDEAGLS